MIAILIRSSVSLSNFKYTELPTCKSFFRLLPILTFTVDAYNIRYKWTVFSRANTIFFWGHVESAIFRRRLVVTVTSIRLNVKVTFDPQTTDNKYKIEINYRRFTNKETGSFTHWSEALCIQLYTTCKRIEFYITIITPTFLEARFLFLRRFVLLTIPSGITTIELDLCGIHIHLLNLFFALHIL